MKILVCGASGFVGRHLTQALRGAGHAVTRAVRTPREPGDIAVDFRNDTSKEPWLPRVTGMDAVVNAVGVLRDSAANPMQRLQAETPAALFAACAGAGVQRIVHISALGVESGVNAPYFTTKLAAEQALNGLPSGLRRLCLRPSVIYGDDGASAKMFRNQARLPVLLLPMGGAQQLQPVHIDDICAAVVRWLGDADAAVAAWVAIGAPGPFDYARLKIPILDMYGQNDHPDVLAGAKRRAAGLVQKGSLKMMVPGADHFFDDRHAALLAHVRTWLDATLAK